jgi:hypothetical protein
VGLQGVAKMRVQELRCVCEYLIHIISFCSYVCCLVRGDGASAVV